jgi:GNAT superfamily N-acetyltransferase
MGGKTVRPATAEDIPALLTMTEAFHAASQLPCAFNRDAMAGVLARMIDADEATVLMTDRGLIGGMLNPAYCDPSWVYAVEMFWWSQGDGMALLRAFEEWALHAGANEVRMTSLAALPRADGILRRVGYAPAEISYSKVV